MVVQLVSLYIYIRIRIYEILTKKDKFELSNRFGEIYWSNLELKSTNAIINIFIKP